MKQNPSPTITGKLMAEKFDLLPEHKQQMILSVQRFSRRSIATYRAGFQRPMLCSDFTITGAPARMPAMRPMTSA